MKQGECNVVVTGLGFITSIGNDSDELTQSLRMLRHGLEVYPPFDKPEIPVKVIGTIKGFDADSTDQEDWTYPSRYEIKRESLRSMAPSCLYAHCAMLQALEDAGLTLGDCSDPGTGLYTASGGSPFLMFNHLDRMHKHGVMRCSPMGVVSSVAGTLNFNLGTFFKIIGPSCSFLSACASSGHAMGFAFEEIRSGRATRMFVVGGEEGNFDGILPFAGMRTLSLQTDPDLASRPFDRGRDGFVGSGGATVIVLENAEVAEARGAKIYAEMAGWGQASDGYSIAISHPDGIGLQHAMEKAISASGLQPADIDYVNAHATSTPIGDLSELRALKSVFGAGTGPVVSSTKGLTGHGICMAGILEAGISVLAIHDGFVPGSAHLTDPDPECAGVNIIRETLSQQVETVLSNSSGFGGANVSLVFRRWPR